MLSFCSATLSARFLPRFVARLVRLELPRLHSPCLDDDTTNTEAIGTKSKFSGVPRFGSRSGSAAAVRLSLFSGTRGRACRLLTHPAPDNLSIIWRRSEEHTSELQSLMRISYAVFCL